MKHLKKTFLLFFSCAGIISSIGIPNYHAGRVPAKKAKAILFTDGIFTEHYPLDSKGRLCVNDQETAPGPRNRRTPKKFLVVKYLTPILNGNQTETTNRSEDAEIQEYDYAHAQQFEQLMYSLGIQGLYGPVPEIENNSFHLPGIAEEIPLPMNAPR